MYWDAAAVRLDEIRFYPIDEQTTMMNLYKAGEVDAIYNHTVPPSWLPIIRRMKDYMDAPENAIEYYAINTTRPPMDDVRVRKAFNMAIDKEALATFRVVVKPLTAFTPEGIFPGYPAAQGRRVQRRARPRTAGRGRVIATARGNYDAEPVSRQRCRDPVQHARSQPPGRRVRPGAVEAEPRHHGAAAQHGIPDLPGSEIGPRIQRVRTRRDGSAITWIRTPSSSCSRRRPGNNSTGWFDPAYVRMLEEANRTVDPLKRYELLAKAEAYMLEAQPVIPLLTRATDWMKKPYVKGLYPESEHAARMEVRLHRARSREVGLRRAGAGGLTPRQRRTCFDSSSAGCWSPSRWCSWS